MKLFLMECGKTARGILYWLFVLVLFFAGVRPLDETVESELRQKDAPLIRILYSGGWRIRQGFRRAD